MAGPMQAATDILAKIVDAQCTPESARANCRLLEEGRILYFERAPYPLPESDLEFLLRQRQIGSRIVKNIAYRPQQDRVTGAAGLSPGDAQRLAEIMRRYSRAVTALLERLLAPYAASWKLDFATFRPVEEKGRKSRMRARNDLLHVDNFPTRPTNGDRILRFFTNVNPSESRRWITTDGFEILVRRFGGTSRLAYPRPLAGWRRAKYLTLRALHRTGLRVAARPPYDEFMLGMHHAMKEDEAFQAQCPKVHLEFPPGSCWAVFTDSVPHAALQGRYALEQTFLISRTSLVAPERSPLCILEQASGRSPLIDSSLSQSLGILPRD